ncbi:MAG: nucleotidyltransferase family protein, partial [Bacteroidota bacterium]|nr:nucleotidyltransferase family protein [Bacteroidota bacterium]
IQLFQTEGTDLENFIQLCSDHLIIPAIYLKLKAHDILAYLPEDFIQALKEIYELNRERNLQILRQIDDITATLNKANIQPVFLKGTANLLDGIYSYVGELMIGNIDFLVKEGKY